MPSGAIPIYFELSWAILSSFSLLNVLAGFLIVGITGFTPLWAVPVVCSASSAIANGLCYIAYYSDASLHTKVPAAALADIFWCTQEAGLSFYSYIILRRFLRGRERLIHLALFWFLMATIFSLRMTILITRAQELLSGTDTKQQLINHLHNGYFSSIALVEVMSSYFLLNIFIKGKQSSTILSQGSNLFKQVIMSTEVRVSTLALIGVGRAITYSFQAEAQSATSVASQLDRFLTTLESYFPIIMLLDLLATRLVSSEYSGATSSRSKYGKSNNITMELNRINEDARQDEDRRAFVLIEPASGDKSPMGRSDKGISKTTTISVDRGNEHA